MLKRIRNHADVLSLKPCKDVAARSSLDHEAVPLPGSALRQKSEVCVLYSTHGHFADFSLTFNVLTLEVRVSRI